MTHPQSLRESIPVAIKLIEDKTQDKVNDVRLVNNNRHAVIYTKKGLTYWLLYKREVFKSFGVIFDKQGVGDSINAEFLGMALNQKIDGFIFCYKQGIIYKISPREVFDYHLVRETDKTEERTYSFPIMVETPWR